MRIVVTGASGFVGRNLVPVLAQSGAELLLVGRDTGRLRHLLPGHPCCTYGEIASRAAGFDVLVHLAVLTSEAHTTLAEYRAVNVAFLLETVARAVEARIPRLINVSTVHALDSRNAGSYATTKREAVDRLRHVTGIDVETVYLPAVTGDAFAGRPGFLNPLPGWLSRPLFVVLAALKPTVSVDRLAGFVLDERRPIAQGEAILANDQSLNRVFTGGKRAIDLLFAAFVAVFLWWLLVLVWLAIRLTSPGPGIFVQQRVGKNAQPFDCYKFRTMKVGAPQAGTHQIPQSMVTPLGRFLRGTKLDELPQILNILRNEVSLVGPRPCLPVQEDLVERRRRAGVLSIKPGITGLAQVEGIDMSDAALLVSWDSRYLALRSLLLDLKIIARTAMGRGRGDKVSEPTVALPPSRCPCSRRRATRPGRLAVELSRRTLWFCLDQTARAASTSRQRFVARALGVWLRHDHDGCYQYLHSRVASCAMPTCSGNDGVLIVSDGK